MAIVHPDNILFKESISHLSDEEQLRKWNARSLRLIDEYKIGQSDFDRLRSVQHVYEARVKRWKGATKFNCRANKFEAEEARAIMRFLKGWHGRSVDLSNQIHEIRCEFFPVSE